MKQKNLRSHAFGAFLLLCAANSAVMAQTQLPDHRPAVSASEDAEGRRESARTRGELLGAGDQLVLNIPDLDEVKNLPVRIASDGSLDLPLIGVVQAGGMTSASLRQLLAVRYSKYVSDPQVSLQIASSQTHTVSILGEINSPGVQEITGPITLLSAISKAGGIRPDAGPQVIVSRNENEGSFALPENMVSNVDGHLRAALPLDDLLAEKSPQNNILLSPGDVITIPKGSIVYVVGEVHKSGGFPLRSSGHVSLIEALALAEGLSANAKTGSAKILRVNDRSTESRKEIPVDIGAILAGKKPDPQLVADDILFVPSSAVKSGARRAAEAILQVTTGILIYR